MQRFLVLKTLRLSRLPLLAAVRDWKSREGRVQGLLINAQDGHGSGVDYPWGPLPCPQDLAAVNRQTLRQKACTTGSSPGKVWWHLPCMHAHAMSESGGIKHITKPTPFGQTFVRSQIPSNLLNRGPSWEQIQIQIAVVKAKCGGDAGLCNPPFSPRSAQSHPPSSSGPPPRRG